MLSLRKRAWISGGISALVSLAVCTLLLYSFLNQRVSERFDAALIERHTQIVAALNSVAGEAERLDELLFDPQYQTPFSGRYWQVTAPDGTIFGSASLLSATLPRLDPAPTSLTLAQGSTLDLEPFRLAEQQITLENTSLWTVSVAESLTQLESERAATRQGLVLAFALVAAIGLGSVLFQTAAIVRPLNKLRHDVSQLWEQDEHLIEADYPEEVSPLVADINGLLERNRAIITRSRRQAADLAHALKTPSAILRNELSALSDGSQDMSKALDALDRLDAQLGRSLARLRTSNSGEGVLAKTDLSNSVDRFGRMFEKMAGREAKELTVRCDPGLMVRMDAQDLEEVLGNLLDNALKWSRTKFTLTVGRRPGGIEVLIEDDGPGIPATDRTEALRSGARLDTSKPGTGLGLAIVNDLLMAYGGTLALEDSTSLGGLAARVTLPVRRMRSGRLS